MTKNTHVLDTLEQEENIRKNTNKKRKSSKNTHI